MAVDLNQIFIDQRQFAKDQKDSMQVFVDALLQVAGVLPETFAAEIDNVTAIDVTGSVLGALTSDRPITFIIPNIGNQPLPTVVDPSFLGIDNIIVPAFGKSAPVLTFPVAPNSDLPSDPVPAQVSNVDIPPSPVLDFPDSPVVTGLDFPIPPTLDLPSFQSTLPIDDLVTPTATFEFAEQPYLSDNLEALRIKIFNDLVDGGYGIEVADEVAIWDRARDREIEGAMSELDNLYVEAASRGFPLPPGDLNVAIQIASQRYTDKLSTFSREVALKRADMFVENRKFTIQQVKEVEQILINFHNLVMERLLNASKAIVEMGIALFNASVARYNARLETYRAEAQVFEAKVRAALARVEIFKAEMEAVKIKSDVQRNQIELYRAQLAAVETIVNVFRTQMEAARVKADIERLKIETFRAQVEAFTAKVQAKVAQFNMFSAQIQGEVAKVQAFEAEAKAYDSVVQGLKVSADINIARARLSVDQSAQRVDVFRGRIAAYEAQLQGQIAEVDALTKKYVADVQLYQATATALAEGFRLRQRFADQTIEAFRANASVSVENAKIGLQNLLGTLNAKTQASSVAGDYFKVIVGGAVGSLMALASENTAT